jgi:ribosome biogenesis ATPase
MPCIIFFDEIDAICPKRGTDGNQVTERVVNSLLAEMDGFENRRQVYVIAATNRPDIIDPAMLRGGRLEKLLYVPLPDKNEKL